MAKREKFGKFILLQELEESGLGRDYRAAKLGSTGIEKVVSVLRLTPALAKHPEAVKALMDQVKLAAQLQNPNVLKIYGIGKVESAYYVSYEYLEGKSVKAIFSRCRQEAFPLSIDHALLIASKVCSALEYAHARKADGGARYFHGLVTPGNVLVSYEGEIRVRGFGYWPSGIRDAGGVSEEESLYLAPEQLAGSAGDPHCDTFAVGVVLFEALVGQPLFQEGRTNDIVSRIVKARVQNPTGDDDSIPKPIAEILHKALAVEPVARYGEIQEMRKAIDTLLFSGDFTPTTFNLAFFMHSLFRDDIERETKALKDERDASYLEYLTEATAPAPVAAPTPAAPPVVALPVPSPQKTQPLDLRQILTPPPPPPAAPAAPEPARVAEPEPVRAPAVNTGTFTFHKEKPKGKMPVIFGGLAATLVIGAAGAYFLTRGTTAPPPPTPVTTTLSTEQAAAMARMKELEEKLQAFEAEKAAAEAKAAEDAKKKMEAQAAAKGQTVDPAALQKAQEDARKKVQLEQDKKVQEEKARLEDQKKVEEARIADEQKRAEEEAARQAAVATTMAPAAPPTTAAPAIRPGTLVNLGDPGVTPPVVVSSPPLAYPPIAQRQRIGGVVTLNVLVDEKGNVLDAQVTQGAGGKVGLNEAAVENVKLRKYRPASKEGVAVKVWITVAVQFNAR